MIYLTELSNVTEGLWWVRESQKDKDRGPWLIAEVEGNSPFFQFYVVLERDTEGPWGSPGRHRNPRPFNPNCWEFGPRIDIPSDKDRVEYAPRQGREKVAA